MGKGGKGKGKSKSRQGTQDLAVGFNEISTEVAIPSHLAGKMIGKGGSNFKNIRNETGVRILQVEPRGTQSVVVIVGYEAAVINAMQRIQVMLPSDITLEEQHLKYPSPHPQKHDMVIAETTDGTVTPPKASEANLEKPADPLSPLVSPRKNGEEASVYEESLGGKSNATSIAETLNTWREETGRLLQSSTDKVRALPRKWQIAGGAAVGAGAAAPAAGVGGAVAGGVGGLILAPLTLGLSVPVGMVVGGGAGFAGGAVVGAGAGAGVTAYLTREQAASEASQAESCAVQSKD